jgi:hypothetical protein
MYATGAAPLAAAEGCIFVLGCVQRWCGLMFTVMVMVMVGG